LDNLSHNLLIARSIRGTAPSLATDAGRDQLERPFPPGLGPVSLKRGQRRAPGSRPRRAS